jgi:hypothetical protein
MFYRMSNHRDSTKLECCEEEKEREPNGTRHFNEYRATPRFSFSIDTFHYSAASSTANRTCFPNFRDELLFSLNIGQFEVYDV